MLPKKIGIFIGILGGSFDPPHRAHLQIAETSLAALQLDKVIWLVAKQNPLKENKASQQAERVHLVEDFLRDHSHFAVQADEYIYAIDSLRDLQKKHPENNFVWLMGSDSWCDLHLWRDWEEFVKGVAIAIYPRPDTQDKIMSAQAASAFADSFVSDVARLASIAPPAWGVLEGNADAISSSAIRRLRDKK